MHFVGVLVCAVLAVIAALVFGMLFAELVNHRYPGRGIVRTMFITPFLIMPVVSALTWKNMMLNPVFGVVDYLMQLVGLPWPVSSRATTREHTTVLRANQVIAGLLTGVVTSSGRLNRGFESLRAIEPK